MTRHHQPRPDLTARQAPVSIGVSPRLKWLCGHLGERKGGQKRGGLLWKCPMCVKAEAV